MEEKHSLRAEDSAPPTPGSSNGSFLSPSRLSRSSSTTYVPPFRNDPVDEDDVFVEQVPADQDTDDVMLLAPWRRTAVRLLGVASILQPLLILLIAKMQLSMLPKEPRVHAWSDRLVFVRVNALLESLLTSKLFSHVLVCGRQHGPQA